MERLRDERLGYGLVVALYLLIFPWHPGLRSPNELCRLWQARALVEDGKVEINAQLQRYGYVGDLSVKDGRYFPSKAPLLSFLAAPIYWVQVKAAGGGPVDELRQVYWSRLLITVLPSLLMLVLLRRFLTAWVSPELADPLLVTFALGSLAFPYAEQFLSHGLTSVLLFSCFYACWRTLRGDWRERGWLAAGALAGAVVVSEYTGSLGVVCVACYVIAGCWKQWPRLGRAVGLVVLGAAPFLAALMAYHQACFGHPLESGYKYLNDAAYQHWHLGGFLGIRIPDPDAFALSFFGPLRGLFVLSPFLLLAFGGLNALRRDRPYLVFVLLLLLANTYFTSSFDYTSWGWTVGPRHLTPMVPFLLLPIGLTLERLRSAASFDARVGAGLAIGLCVASVLITGLVVMVNYVPDSVSTALFGLAVPLFEDGFLPPTVLTVFGFGGGSALPLLLVGSAALLVGAQLVLAQRAKAVAVSAAVTVVAVLGLLAGATRHDDYDKGAVGHLKSVWLTAPPPKS